MIVLRLTSGGERSVIVVYQDWLRFLISRRIFTHQGGATASKFDVLNDVTGGNCWNAGYLSTYKVQFLVECVWRQWCLPLYLRGGE